MVIEEDYQAIEGKFGDIRMFPSQTFLAIGSIAEVKIKPSEMLVIHRFIIYLHVRFYLNLYDIYSFYVLSYSNRNKSKNR